MLRDPERRAAPAPRPPTARSAPRCPREGSTSSPPSTPPCCAPPATTPNQEHGFDPADYVAPADVAALLHDDWHVEADEKRPCTITGGAGSHHTHDLLLRARSPR